MENSRTLRKKVLCTTHFQPREQRIAEFPIPLDSPPGSPLPSPPTQCFYIHGLFTIVPTAVTDYRVLSQVGSCDGPFFTFPLDLVPRAFRHTQGGQGQGCAHLGLHQSLGERAALGTGGWGRDLGPEAPRR